jgi:hypothetical protein
MVDVGLVVPVDVAVVEGDVVAVEVGVELTVVVGDVVADVVLVLLEVDVLEDEVVLEDVEDVEDVDDVLVLVVGVVVGSTMQTSCIPFHAQATSLLQSPFQT